jgi:hypothetical protein
VYIHWPSVSTPVQLPPMVDRPQARPGNSSPESNSIHKMQNYSQVTTFGCFMNALGNHTQVATVSTACSFRRICFNFHQQVLFLFSSLIELSILVMTICSTDVLDS